MKKYLTLFTAGIILIISSCATKGDIDNLQSQIDGLRSGQIATIENQINSINGSISSLQEADREIKGYITALQNTALELQKSINSADGKIDDLEKALVLVNTAIENLKAKDSALEQRITDLKDYVDTQLRGAKDWVSATFATLEQYNGIVSEIGGIKGSISSINTALEQMESRLNGKITLMKGEIEEAYTKAIGSLETTLKNWVNEQLEGYWTIAETEGKLETLEGNLSKEDESIRGDIGKLRASLDSARTELTEGYKAAIKKAIEENNGVLEGKLSEAVSGLNTRIDGEVSTINERIGKLEKRVLDLESAVSELLSRVQSLAYIPRYTDGASTMWYRTFSYGDSIALDTLDFRVSPTDCADALVEVWKNSVSAEAESVYTRGSQIVSLPVVSVTGGNGKISIVLDGSSLGEKFFTGEQQMKAVVFISDGNNERSSDYISMVPKDEPSLVGPVDMGLSVRWATCNISDNGLVSEPEEYGDFYAWGETEPKQIYIEDNYKWGHLYSYTKYSGKDNKTVLETGPEGDDVASKKLGGNWRIPTDEEWTELRTQCTWTWTKLNGVNGCFVTSKNGNKVFLPAGGFSYQYPRYGVNGDYWSASLVEHDRIYDPRFVFFDSNSVIGEFTGRYFGMRVRPVLD